MVQRRSDVARTEINRENKMGSSSWVKVIGEKQRPYRGPKDRLQHNTSNRQQDKHSWIVEGRVLGKSRSNKEEERRKKRTKRSGRKRQRPAEMVVVVVTGIYCLFQG